MTDKTKTHSRRGFCLTAALAITTGLAALTPGAAAADTPIRFTLDWRFEGPAAPFLLALDRGYFAEEGLSVTIDAGQGSVDAINRVAAGAYDISFGDINTLIRLLDAEPDTPVRAVFMLYNSPPFAVVGRKSQGVFEPKDLEGRRLGAPAPDGAFAQWPIFVAENDIDESLVTIENVGFPVREPMLLAGQVDAITGFAFSSYLAVQMSLDDPDDATLFLMSDYGLELYGNALIASTRLIEENPEALEGFLRAVTRGIHSVIEDPEAALPYVLARSDIARPELEELRLQYALEMNILTDEVMENGLGGIDPERMARAFEQLALVYDFQREPTVEGVFDARFLPPLEDRMVAQ